MEDLGEGKEWEGWDEVLLAWAGVGSVAASMRMVCMGGQDLSMAEGGGGTGGAADWRS